jgi:hypothetical protein
MRNRAGCDTSRALLASAVEIKISGTAILDLLRRNIIPFDLMEIVFILLEKYLIQFGSKL